MEVEKATDLKGESWKKQAWVWDSWGICNWKGSEAKSRAKEERAGGGVAHPGF